MSFNKIYTGGKFDNTPINFSKIQLTSNVKDGDSINFVLDDPLSIGVSLEWGDTPGAIITSKLREFMLNKAFMLFSGEKYDYHTATNKWSQLALKGGSPITLDFTFRALPKDNGTGTLDNYNKIFRFLLKHCVPAKRYNLGDLGNNIGKSIDKTREYGRRLGNGSITDITKYENDEDVVGGKGATQKMKEVTLSEIGTEGSILNTLDNMEKYYLDKNLGQTPDNQVKFSVNGTQCDGVSFYIKSFELKPSSQGYKNIIEGNDGSGDVTFEDIDVGSENETYYATETKKYGKETTFTPLYSEFKVSIETSEVLSIEQLNTFFNLFYNVN